MNSYIAIFKMNALELLLKLKLLSSHTLMVLKEVLGLISKIKMKVFIQDVQIYNS
jgi:hypothetical protein